MSQFFITRPVFAWVIAIFIALTGIVAIPQMPVARFPDIAPPSVSVFATYSGADAQTVSDSVVRPIEKELSSVKNVLYYESSVDSTGGANITVTFRPGTNPELDEAISRMDRINGFLRQGTMEKVSYQETLDNMKEAIG